jgi:hypothetical protein
MKKGRRSWGGGGLLCCGLALALAGGAEGAVPSVTVIQAAAWSQGDAAREGASEFLVLMETARIRRQDGGGGLVAVGNRRGFFGVGAERALELAVLQGVPVVKLAAGGQVRPSPHGLFLDGGGLSAEAARQVLERCVERHGTWAAASEPTPELRARLAVFQRELTLAAGGVPIAMR